jgi:uncharacterized membrane protein
MQFFLTVTLAIHIICGFSALITGFISMLNRKGGKQHRLTGKIFFAGITGVFVSATIISIAKQLAFLFMVGFFSYYLACSGYRVLRVKKGQQQAKAIDWVISLTGVLAGLALMGFSITWFMHWGAWGAVPLTFGIFCLVNGLQDIRSYTTQAVDKQYRIRKHGARMGGAFAATLTAFIVVNVHIGSSSWILWILPGVLTGIWISRAIKNYLGGSKPVKQAG